jgi:penicillin-insensitive murein endopeptidase
MHRRVPKAAFVAGLLATWLSAGPAHAWPEPDGAAAADATAETAASRRSRSVSVGETNRGSLQHGVRIEDSATIRVKDGTGARYGTEELVRLIERAAARVAERHAGSVLVVGDISGPAGGRIRPHRSHRSGRDADIGFYLRDAAGEPAVVPRFVNMGRDGTGTHRDGAVYRFDVERNWELVTALITEGREIVQYVFVARSLREMLLEHARRSGAPADLIAQAETVMHLPSRGPSHVSHFHVRIYCPRDDRDVCFDSPPFHAWIERPPPRPEPRVARRGRGSRATARPEARRPRGARQSRPQRPARPARPARRGR